MGRPCAQAMATITKYTAALMTFNEMDGVEVEVAPLKKLYRLLEKIFVQGTDVEAGCSGVLDVVRGMIRCSTNSVQAEVLKRFGKHPDFTVYKVGFYRYAKFDKKQWLDCKVIAAMAEDGNQFKTETQIVHRKMLAAREDMGGHDNYSNFRSLGEAVMLAKKQQGDTDKQQSKLLAQLESQFQDRAFLSSALAFRGSKSRHGHYTYVYAYRSKEIRSMHRVMKASERDLCIVLWMNRFQIYM